MVVAVPPEGTRVPVWLTPQLVPNLTTELDKLVALKVPEELAVVKTQAGSLLP